MAELERVLGVHEGEAVGQGNDLMAEVRRQGLLGMHEGEAVGQGGGLMALEHRSGNGRRDVGEEETRFHLWKGLRCPFCPSCAQVSAYASPNLPLHVLACNFPLRSLPVSSIPLSSPLPSSPRLALLPPFSPSFPAFSSSSTLLPHPASCPRQRRPQKCRRLESLLSETRGKAAQAEDRAAAQEARAKDAAQRAEEIASENARLHAELDAAQQALAGMVRGGGAAARGESRSVSRAEHHVAGTAAGGMPGGGDGIRGHVGAEEGEELDGKAAMVAALVSQRDRLRRKAGELEGDIEVLKGRLRDAEGLAAQLRRDNVALVERMRFAEELGARGR